MAVDKARKNLGRGLASLFGDVGDGPKNGEGVLGDYNLKSADVPIEDVVPSSLQPRLEFAVSYTHLTLPTICSV